MNKVQLSVAALAFGAVSMLSMTPAFAEDTMAPAAAPVVAPTCVCPADKADCKVDANAEDCVKNGGTVAGDMKSGDMKTEE